MAALSILLRSFLALNIAHAAIQCTYNDAEADVTYDLSDLQEIDSLWVLASGPSGQENQFQVYNFSFAICRELKSSETPQICIRENKDSFSGYQIPLDNSACHTLGKYDASTNLKVLHYDEKARGIRLTYVGDSSTCQSGVNELSIDVLCSDDHSLKPSYITELKDDGTTERCHHKISVKSIHGCPVQCTSGPDKDSKPSLCSGRGVCAFDKSNKKARCFCDEGFDGHNCAQIRAPINPSASASGTTTLLVLLLFIAIGLLFMVVYLAKQIKAYRNDALNYMQIRGAEMVDQF